jgi:hypothetical protein
MLTIKCKITTLLEKKSVKWDMKQGEEFIYLTPKQDPLKKKLINLTSSQCKMLVM